MAGTLRRCRICPATAARRLRTPAPAGAVECPECGGYGTVLSMAVNPYTADTPATCDECGGDGFVMPDFDAN